MCKAGRYAPWLMATAIFTDSRRCSSKRWHVADIKNIAGDDRRWSIDISQISHIPSDFTCVYVYEISTGAPWLMSTAVDTDSNHRFSKSLHVADVKNIASVGPAMTRINRNFIIMKMYAYEIKQDLSKDIFLLLGCRHYDSIAHLQLLLFSPMKNYFSTTLSPTKNPRYTYWKVFFVDFVYSKIIDIMRGKNICVLFLNRESMCKAGHPDNGAILQVVY